MSTPTIEVAHRDDAEGICKVIAEGWVLTYPNEKLGITNQMVADVPYGPDGELRPGFISKTESSIMKQDDSLGIHVAREGQEVVGVSWAKRVAEQRSRLAHLYVARRHQAYGIGSALLDNTFDWSQGSAMELQVAEYNKNAIGLYVKKGFVPGESVQETKPITFQSDNGPIEVPEITMVRPADTEPKLQVVKFPDLWLQVRAAMHKGPYGKGTLHLTRDEMAGFEDVIPEGFGNGLYYNTSMSISQMVMALAVAPNPDIRTTLAKTSDEGMIKTIATLRDKQVLEGFKLLDLGSGILPGLAIASKSMGAEVHTVDGEAFKANYQDVDSHTVVDILAEDAIEKVRQNAGDQFDYITCNVIGNVPGHPSWKFPNELDIERWGAKLLKPGGYSYYAGHDLKQKV